MSETKSVNFSVVNNTGREMPRLWANHNTSDTPIQAWTATNVAAGATVNWSGLEIVSRTDDYFTVMWLDAANNVYGTPYRYDDAETSINGGDVSLQLQAATFQFFQNSEGPLDDPTQYLQYEIVAS